MSSILEERLKNRDNPQSRPKSTSIIPDFMDMIQSQAPAQSTMEVRKVPLDQIDPWRDAEGKPQPFRLYPTEKLQEMAESIRQNGLFTPVRLRINPYDMSRYQTLAGHNRIMAAKMAGLTEIDAIVENVDDATAEIIVVDTNLNQREKILPSEKAFAYKMRLDALKKKVGRKSKKNASQVETHFRSDEELAEISDDSRAQIQRYISLTRLIPSLLEWVDTEAIPFTAGVSLSFLSPADQERLWSVLQSNDIKGINRAQAEELKAMRKELTEKMILRIFGITDKSAEPKPQVFRFALDVSPEIAKKYRKDERLQQRIAAAINDYIREMEEI